MKRKILVGLVVTLFIVCGIVSQRALGRTAAAQAAKQAPLFQVDPSWPQLPNNMATGLVSSVAVDQKDNVWILHRPRVSVPKGKTPAPPVIQLDANGKYVQGWGGPSDAYEWPDSEHGIYVDETNSVWIGGSSRPGAGVCADALENKCTRGDDMLLKFTTQGKFIMAIGKRNANTGAKDTQNVHSPTDVFVYKGELYVSDGYEGPGNQGNRRAIVFDANTGAFKRMWGAYGNVPKDAKEAPAPPAPEGGRGRGAPPVKRQLDPGPDQFTGVVHSLEVSKDGFVYVADRANQRIQVFTPQGKYVNQIFIDRPGDGRSSAAGLGFSTDPEQKYIFVADMGNSHVVVVDRQTRETLYHFGKRGAAPGDFQGLHNMVVDSKGNLYTAEVAPGARAQKFVYKGIGPVPAQ
jgi:DNA-binding beta-propeller fold protein YncE